MKKIPRAELVKLASMHSQGDEELKKLLGEIQASQATSAKTVRGTFKIGGGGCCHIKLAVDNATESLASETPAL